MKNIERTCRKCGETKPIEGPLENDYRYLTRYTCDKCKNESKRLWYLSNKNRLSEKSKEYRTKNKEVIAKRSKLWREVNKSKMKDYHRIYFQEHHIKKQKRDLLSPQICVTCGELKSINEFRSNRRSCKSCEYKKHLLWASLNRVRINERQNNKYHNGYAATKKASSLKYYELNKDIIKEKSKTYRNRNSGKIAERRKKMYVENKDKIKDRYRLKYEANYNGFRNNNIQRATAYNKRLSDNLDDKYVVFRITRVSKLSREYILQHPDLIENYRKQIELKRLIKNQKNGESIETS